MIFAVTLLLILSQPHTQLIEQPLSLTQVPNHESKRPTLQRLAPLKLDYILDQRHLYRVLNTRLLRSTILLSELTGLMDLKRGIRVHGSPYISTHVGGVLIFEKKDVQISFPSIFFQTLRIRTEVAVHESSLFGINFAWYEFQKSEVGEFENHCLRMRTISLLEMEGNPVS